MKYLRAVGRFLWPFVTRRTLRAQSAAWMKAYQTMGKAAVDEVEVLRTHLEEFVRVSKKRSWAKDQWSTNLHLKFSGVLMHKEVKTLGELKVQQDLAKHLGAVSARMLLAAHPIERSTEDDVHPPGSGPGTPPGS
jgi:hypothetical protein